LIDPAFLSTLYLATDVGVMISTNDGTSWSVYSQGIPSNVPCHDLTIHNGTRKLVVWTHGRSVFAASLPPVGIISYNETPDGFSLSQNYPNPFNPKTKIKYSIAESGIVSLKVFDIQGKIAAVVVDKHQNKGVYEAEIDGTNLSSGVYFYRVQSGKFSDTKKMILVK
jgi:hypothetical protein